MQGLIIDDSFAAVEGVLQSCSSFEVERAASMMPGLVVSEWATDVLLNRELLIESFDSASQLLD